MGLFFVHVLFSFVGGRGTSHNDFIEAVLRLRGVGSRDRGC